MATQKIIGTLTARGETFEISDDGYRVYARHIFSQDTGVCLMEYKFADQLYADEIVAEILRLAFEPRTKVENVQRSG